MKLLASLLFFAIALGAAGLALWLLTRAGHREREEEVMLRLRAMGAADADAVTLPRDERIRNPIVRWTCHVLWRTGAEVDPPTVGRALMVLTLLLPLALMIFGWLIGLTVVAVLVGVAYGVLARRAAARRAKILEQMPGYIETVVRVLSAGNTLEEALAASARESPEPLRALFLSVGRQMRLGAPVEETLAQTAEIHRLYDLKVLGLAASINRKYGGSLRNILKSLMNVIRARAMATRELKALTAETRGSALALVVIPIGLTLYILAQNPAYYAEMWADTPWGRGFLIGSVLAQITGAFVIWRMLHSVEEGAG